MLLRSITSIIFLILACLSAEAALTPSHIIGSKDSDTWYWIELSFDFSKQDHPSKPNHIIRVYPQSSGNSLQTKEVHEFNGKLKSSIIIDDQLHLVYNNNIFALTQGGNTLPVYSTTQGENIWAMMETDSSPRFLKLNEDQNLVLDDNKGNEFNLSLKDKLKGDLVFPFSGKNIIVLLGFTVQRNMLENGNSSFLDWAHSHLTFIEFVDQTPVIWDHTFENTSFSNVSVMDDEIWFLPRNSDNMITLKIGERTFGEMKIPYPSNEENQWISATQIHDEIAWLGYHPDQYRFKIPGQNEDIYTPITEKDIFRPIFYQKAFSEGLIQGLLLATLFAIYRLRRKKEKELIAEKKLSFKVLPASLLTRSMATVFDFFIILFPCKLLYAGLFGIDFYLFNTPDRHNYFLQNSFLQAYNQQLFVMSVIFLVFYILYNAVMEYLVGGSLGKLFFRLALFTDDHQKPSLKQILIKSLARIIDGIFIIGFFVALFSKKKKTIGDYLAKSIVGQKFYY